MAQGTGPPATAMNNNTTATSDIPNIPTIPIIPTTTNNTTTVVGEVAVAM